MDEMENSHPRVIAAGIAGEGVSAALVNQRLAPDEAAKLFTALFTAALAALTTAAVAAPETEQVEQPTAAQIKKSIQPDGLVSFIDGKAYKTLKRHLTSHGLGPDTYRAKYGLPADYPMTAPNYSAARSQLAKSLGLGNGGRQAAETSEAA